MSPFPSIAVDYIFIGNEQAMPTGRRKIDWDKTAEAKKRSTWTSGRPDIPRLWTSGHGAQLVEIAKVCQRRCSSGDEPTASLSIRKRHDEDSACLTVRQKTGMNEQGGKDIINIMSQ